MSNLDPSKQDLAAFYRIRFFEDAVTDLRAKLEIQGSVHLCSGQEAIYVGGATALTREDRVFGTYRGHGWALACGVPPELMFAELLGRETGVCKGRGGSAYFSAPDWGFYGENSIVGAGAPIATGAALAAKFEKKGRVCLTAFGDGAMNQGGVHEAMNFAAYLDLPVIFVCENNTYSELTPIRDMVRMPDLYKRAAAYGMPGVRVDGNDVEAVRAAVAEFAAAARAGKGPALIEAMTQRIVGHYIGDVQAYRPKGELKEIMKTEPIVLLREKLAGQGVSAAELDGIAATVKNEIGAAVKAARAAPLADAQSVREHVHA
jgi:TPP-dependent pyruvate/acetoin dehydrogenase alpha subunit